MTGSSSVGLFIRGRWQHRWCCDPLYIVARILSLWHALWLPQSVSHADACCRGILRHPWWRGQQRVTLSCAHAIAWPLPSVADLYAPQLYHICMAWIETACSFSAGAVACAQQGFVSLAKA